MERTPKALWHDTSGWDAWDAAPRDGPAVFVVDAAAFDRGDVVGMWVDPYENAQVVREQLSELLGRDAERGAWAIVDQVGLGPAMVTETPAAQELRSETIATFGPQDEDDSTTLDLLPK